jgi:predicted MFS family arabinose efflux permease
MTGWRTFLFAVAGGAAVGNLYWAQPLLATIGTDFGVTVGSAALLLTVTQLGYALGVFFVVPLGDTANRRRLIPIFMGLSVLALIGTAVAPAFWVLLAALTLVGVASVSGQLLTPLAGDLTDDTERGSVLGRVASGLMLGLLISRAISGLVADALGWRSVYVLAAALTAVLTLLMTRAIPPQPGRQHIPYFRLLRSVFTPIAEHRAVRVTQLLGALLMSVFTLFWTGLTLLLSSEPYSYSTTQIGLISLVGVAGAIAAQRVGRLYDRGLAVPAIGVGLVITFVALVAAGLGATVLPVLLLAIATFSVGVQSSLVLLQTRMLSIDPDARSRLNTVFIVSNFLGGAIGSTLASTMWSAGGWTGLSLAAGTIVALTFLVWGWQRSRALRD